MSVSRLFFAALPDETTRGRIAAAARDASIGAPASMVPPQNYHLTLGFVGEVTETRAPELTALGGLLRARGFSLCFDAYEYWPKPEVVVAAARSIPPQLEELWRGMHRDLETGGWALDAKRLRPHVTLARKVAQAPVLKAMCVFEWVVRDFFLMRSDSVGSQSSYTVVDHWPLLDEKTIG